MEIFHNDWKTPLAPELEQQYYRELRKFLITEYRTRQIFPDMYDIFNALHYTSLADTKVLFWDRTRTTSRGRHTV
jgi:uracil-DNA glycosylase